MRHLQKRHGPCFVMPDWRIERRRRGEVRHEHTREVVRSEQIPQEVIDALVDALTTVIKTVAELDQRVARSEGAYSDIANALVTVGQLADELQRRRG